MAERPNAAALRTEHAASAPAPAPAQVAATDDGRFHPQTQEAYDAADTYFKGPGKNLSSEQRVEMAGAFQRAQAAGGSVGFVESVQLVSRMPGLTPNEAVQAVQMYAAEPQLREKMQQLPNDAAGMQAITGATRKILSLAGQDMVPAEVVSTVHLLRELPPGEVVKTLDTLMTVRANMGGHGMIRGDYVDMCDKLETMATSLPPEQRGDATRAFATTRPYLHEGPWAGTVSEVSLNPTTLAVDERRVQDLASRARDNEMTLEARTVRATGDVSVRPATETVNSSGVKIEEDTHGFFKPGVARQLDEQGRYREGVPVDSTFGVVTRGIRDLGVGVGAVLYGYGAATGQMGTRINESSATSVTANGNAANVNVGGTQTLSGSDFRYGLQQPIAVNNSAGTTLTTGSPYASPVGGNSRSLNNSGASQQNSVQTQGPNQ